MGFHLTMHWTIGQTD